MLIFPGLFPSYIFIAPGSSGSLTVSIPFSRGGDRDSSYWTIQKLWTFEQVASEAAKNEWDVVANNEETPTSFTVTVPDTASNGLHRLTFHSLDGGYYVVYFMVGDSASLTGPNAPVPHTITDSTAKATAPSPLKSPFVSYRLQWYNPTTSVWTTGPTGLTAGMTGTVTGLPDDTSGLRLRFVGVNNLGVETNGAQSITFSTLMGDDAAPTTCVYHTGGKSRSLEYHEHLQSNTTSRAILYKITRRDGVVFAYTNHVEDVNGSSITRDGDTYPQLAGVTFKSATGISPTGIANSSGLDPDNMEVQAILDDDEITAEDLNAGLFDDASVEIAEFNYEDLSQGVMWHKRGNLGDIKWGRAQFTAELRALAQRLSAEILELTSLICRVRQLGDERCKVNLNGTTLDGLSIKKTGTITSVSSRRQFDTADIAAYAADRFAYGRVRITNPLSKNYNVWRKVRSNNSNTIAVAEEWAYDLEAGDTFEAIMGCNRLIATCGDVFGNNHNFRGEPHLPGVKVYDKISAGEED